MEGKTVPELTTALAIALVDYVLIHSISGGELCKMPFSDFITDLEGKLTNVGGVNYDLSLASGEYHGETKTATVDENTAGYGGALFFASDGHYEDADNSDILKMPCSALALAGGTGEKTVLRRGRIKNTAWSFSAGALIYPSTNGAISDIPTIVSGEYVQVLGYAEAADTVVFEPSLVVVEI